jgi:hypothetical protein
VAAECDSSGAANVGKIEGHDHFRVFASKYVCQTMFSMSRGFRRQSSFIRSGRTSRWRRPAAKLGPQERSPLGDEHTTARRDSPPSDTQMKFSSFIVASSDALDDAASEGMRVALAECKI